MKKNVDKKLNNLKENVLMKSENFNSLEDDCVEVKANSSVVFLFTTMRFQLWTGIGNWPSRLLANVEFVNLK